jgi:galactose mutarotase-like enzyme
MKYELENEFLKIEMNTLGAELTGITELDDGYSYLWQGDSAFWNRSAPVLFPIIGNLNGSKYLYKGKEYLMGRHGFASGMDFHMKERNQNFVTFSLNHNEATLSQYPFEYQLMVTYTLYERTLTTSYRVENTGAEKMWFSIGGHPGFNCSTGPEGKKKGVLVFEKMESAYRMVNESGYLTGRQEPFFGNTNAVNIDSISFDGKTKVYIFYGLQSKEITLRNDDGGKQVSVKFNGFPYLGIWSRSDAAPFICIEPWYGVTSTRGCEDILDKKRGILSLDPGKHFECSYEIITSKISY